MHAHSHLPMSSVYRLDTFFFLACEYKSSLIVRTESRRYEIAGICELLFGAMIRDTQMLYNLNVMFHRPHMCALTVRVWLIYILEIRGVKFEEKIFFRADNQTIFSQSAKHTLKVFRISASISDSGVLAYHIIENKVRKPVLNVRGSFTGSHTTMHIEHSHRCINIWDLLPSRKVNMYKVEPLPQHVCFSLPHSQAIVASIFFVEYIFSLYIFNLYLCWPDAITRHNKYSTLYG